MKYVAYYRVSTGKQGQSGLGLEAQKRDIGIFMDSFATEGDNLIAEFVEVESGRQDDRQKLEEAMLLCKEQGATLLVSKLDRLSRRVSFIASLLEDRAFQFKVAQMPYADKFQLHIYAALAEQERDFISQRTKAALAVKKAEGVKLGAAAHKESVKPRGLKRQPLAAIQFATQFEPELKIMRDVGLTYAEISDKFNAKGYKTREGGSFSKGQVQRMCVRLEIR